MIASVVQRVVPERPPAGPVASRVAGVRESIAAAAARAGRDPQDVTLVGVSKFIPVDAVRQAIAAGVADLGESRAQELVAKTQAFDLPQIRWHFIGRLQRNKARDVVGRTALLHSIDRPQLVAAVGDAARAAGVVQSVLVQVNVGGDPDKAGVSPAETETLVAAVDGDPALRCLGLMTIPPLGVDPRPLFAMLRDLRDDLVRRHPSVTNLSMGMSNDFEVAVEEGATIVRVGEAVFGPRPATQAARA